MALETIRLRLLAVDCCDELVAAIKHCALGSCVETLLRAAPSQDIAGILSAQSIDAAVISGALPVGVSASPAALLLLTEDAALSRQCGRSGIMTARPGELSVVLPSLFAAAEKLRTLRDRQSSLQQRLDDNRIVARAKLLLISRLGMSEGAAHRYIEKAAMDSCLPRREVAEGIIRTYEE